MKGAMNGVFACTLALLTTLAASPTHAQPALAAKPVRLVVGAPPGGANDTVARLVAQHLELGQPVIVENKNGAAQMIAADYVARSPADGSVLFLTSHTGIAIAPVLQKVKTFDPIKSFTAVGLIGTAPTRPRGRSLAAGQHGAGARRLRQVESGPGQLRQRRRRHLSAHDRRAVRAQ